MQKSEPWYFTSLRFTKGNDPDRIEIAYLAAAARARTRF